MNKAVMNKAVMNKAVMNKAVMNKAVMNKEEMKSEYVTQVDLDFGKLDGLLAVVIQDAMTQRVLMVGFMNAEAYARTLETGFVVFFSRSRNKLWMKGETSGHTLQVVAMSTDCDRDALLITVKANGPGVCHEGFESCFSRTRVNNNWIVSDPQPFSPNDVYSDTKEVVK
jgi:phosphoribosyl-AMP cyclohydrolase